MVQILTGCTDFGVPVGTYFGNGITRSRRRQHRGRPTRSMTATAASCPACARPARTACSTRAPAATTTACRPAMASRSSAEPWCHQGWLLAGAERAERAKTASSRSLFFRLRLTVPGPPWPCAGIPPPHVLRPLDRDHEKPAEPSSRQGTAGPQPAAATAAATADGAAAAQGRQAAGTAPAEASAAALTVAMIGARARCTGSGPTQQQPQSGIGRLSVSFTSSITM